MKFINKDTGLELLIDVALLKRIVVYGRKKYPNEFGGLLIGRYVKNHEVVIIEDTLLPQKYKSSKYSFERGSEGLKELLEVNYNAMPSLIYVGEWHTHPDNSATPSQTDLKAMRELANDKNVLINNPVLMILGLAKSGCVVNIYFLHNKDLLKYDEEKG